jgi:glycosyltransferase involved in cell wall biosynthesis
MTTSSEAPSHHRRDGVLLYGMYDLTGLDRAPKVRIEMMTRALSGRTHTERITGVGRGRVMATWRWLRSGGPGRVGAVYVEPTTTTALPTDLAFLLLMRLLGHPVGVYFRDAYQFYRYMYPRRKLRIIMDWAWRVTTPVMAQIATVRYVQSLGLAKVLHLRSPQLLPPGTDPASPDLGAGSQPLVGYVGGTGWADGYEMLVAAMALVRERCPDAKLVTVGALPPERQASLPPYVEARRTGRDGLVELLRDVRVCVIPRPITEYTNFVLPIKLWDYLSYGKPIVATQVTETTRLLEASGAGIVTPDTAEGLAEGIVRMLTEDGLAERCAAAARAYTVAPANTWDARARTVLETLGVAAGPVAAAEATAEATAGPDSTTVAPT